MSRPTRVSRNRPTERVGSRYRAMINDARKQAEQVAGRVRDGKKPVKTLSKLGIELTAVSHRAASGVLRKQTRLIEHQIDALAGRLHAAARAGSIGDLVRGQIRLVPENASRLVEDTRQTFSVVAEAGGEVRELVAGTVAELRGAKSNKASTAKRRKPAGSGVGKKASRSAGKAAKTKAAGKAASKKAPKRQRPTKIAAAGERASAA